MESNGETVSDLVKISEWETLLEDAFSSDEYLEHGLDPRFGLYIFIYVYNKDVKRKATPVPLAEGSPVR